MRPLNILRVTALLMTPLTLPLAGAVPPLTIDVFTTIARPIALGEIASNPSIALNVVEVDAIEHFETTLSTGLPSDPDTAQRTVRARLAALDEHVSAILHKSAMGLASAAQLGIDRTPAIVFNHTAVVYGVTDLTEALRRFRDHAASPQ